MSNTERTPLVAVVGPTASGKTALAVALAKLYDAEVVSFDSMQIYKGMDVATAKPTPEEMQGVPHHLIDAVDPADTYSVARFQEDAGRIVRDITERGKRVILVGGTGLYLDAFIQNLTFLDTGDTTEVRARLRKELDEQGVDALYDRLCAIDPEYAAGLHKNNTGRVLRALEVYELTGYTMSYQIAASRETPGCYDVCYIGLNARDRDVLYRRIDVRVEQMLERGLLQEAEEAFRHPTGSTAAQAIGIKEMFPYLRGEETLEACTEKLKADTRHYAKRQLTWFRRNPDVHWLYIDEQTDFDELVEAARQIIETEEIFLNERTKQQLWRILLLGLSVLALVYIVYQVYLVAHEAVRTEVARQTTVDATVDAEAFIVRNEKYLENTSDGVQIPLVGSGSRVAAGEGVIAVFSDKDDASSYAELMTVQNNLNRYTRLNQQKDSYAVNLSAMTRSISRSVIDLAATVDSGDLSGMQDQLYDVRDQIITRQIATGESINLENKVTELENRRSTLSNKTQGYETLVSEQSGYYIDSADGYERATSYKNVSKLTPDDVKKLLKADPDKVSEDVIGKVMTNFDWYLVSVLDADKAKSLKVGSEVTVNLPYSAVSSVDATVVSKKSDKKGDETAVVLKCNRMNAYIASLRKEQAEIVMHTYTGLKIPKEAVTKNEDGDEGVYVLEGNIAKFKKLRTLYTEDDYLISGETAKEGETGSFVKLYDAVIVGGKDLYDGKILN